MSKNIEIENARILFRDFGANGKFANGKRTFCVVIDDNWVPELEEEGYRIRKLEPNNPDDEPLYFMKVVVSYKISEPQILLLTKNGRSYNRISLDESNVSQLDYAEIDNVDLVLTGSSWTWNNESGKTAYLRKAYVTVATDKFSQKYCFDGVDDESSNEVPF